MSEKSKIRIYREKLAEKPKDAEVSDRLFSIEYMRECLLNLISEKHYANALRAMDVMVKYHSGAVRKGSAHIPYIVHPMVMASQAFALGIDDDEIVSACLLHDVLEDSDATEDDLEMPEIITEAVKILSFDKKSGSSWEEAKEIYYDSIASNRIATIVKVLDRCNNISNMTQAFSHTRMNEYIDETEKYIMPLLEIMKDENANMANAVFILKYHMISVLDSLKPLI
ncbi:MAG: hypothetical protein MJ104_02870 [Lachnospiraceae bacterium]|nr:hypothetical protein [Lachnospiraceae bacterium]